MQSQRRFSRNVQNCDVNAEMKLCRIAHNIVSLIGHTNPWRELDDQVRRVESKVDVDAITAQVFRMSRTVPLQ